MSEERDVFSEALANSLTGKGAHVDTVNALKGLDWRQAGEKPGAAPHSVYQILNHLLYWQDLVVGRMRGEKIPMPEHAEDSWPGPEGPESEAAWQDACQRFEQGREEAIAHARESDLFAQTAKMTALDALRLTALHNSYHMGQIALLRRMLGTWPPPEGGATW